MRGRKQEVRSTSLPPASYLLLLVSYTLMLPKGAPMLSRVADSLYWMSRYLERAEHTARLSDVYLNHVLEQSIGNGQPRYRILASLWVPAPDAGIDNDYQLVELIT